MEVGRYWAVTNRVSILQGGFNSPPSYKIESYEQDESIPTHCKCEVKESVS